MTTFEELVPGAPKGRFDNIERTYTPEDVKRLRGSLAIRHTIAEHGSARLWQLLHDEDYVNSLGAMSGNQAMQMVRAGLKAIYLSGWQVAADAEAGFGGPLNAFELMKAYIEAGAAGVHYEDQLASEKKCGHLGGKVLIPMAAHIRNLTAARLAADVMGVASLVICRTDAEAAKLLTSDVDERDRPFVDYDAGRTAEGFYRVRNGMEPCIARANAFAPYSDLVWCETSKPDLEQARQFAEAVRKEHPDQMLAYNCSPSFNWKKNLDDATIAKFQRELGAMGYKFQFITLAGFHQLNHGMYELARGYKERQMAAYSELQEAEFASEANGYTATRHQREVGTGYFDAVSMAITGGQSSTTAMGESTESDQFNEDAAPARAA